MAGVLAAGSLHAETVVVAQVGDKNIPAETVSTYFKNLTPTERAALEQNPALLSQTVRALLLQQVLLSEAKSAGWDKQPEVVDRLERAKEGIIAESYLQTVAKVPDGYPSEADLQSAYEARKAELIVPKQYLLAQIFIVQQGADKAAADQAKGKVDGIVKKLKAGGADFAAVAREASDERETGARGGEIGWLTEASLQPEIRQGMTALGKGAISDPIKLNDGWYVIKVMDIREPRQATLEDVKPQLTQVLQADRSRLNREAYLAKMQQQNVMAINELALAKLLQETK